MIRISLGITAVLSLSPLLAQADGAILRCGGFEPAISIDVTKTHILVGQTIGAEALAGVGSQPHRAGIIGRIRGMNIHNMMALRTYSKIGGVGYFLAFEAHQCSESDVDQNGKLIGFFYADMNGVISGCCNGPLPRVPD